MAPFSLVELMGQFGFYSVVFLIGLGFGSVLEMSGFGDSRKLAAQFYLKDMTVLKVMFGAIIVAMTLIFLTSSLGWLDYDYLWVNPTYLLPGIVGGLIMGVGFVVGGFCPGTSLVALASLKLDGLFFVGGVLFGIFVFGETIDSTFSGFWNSNYFGRLTLQDLLGLDAGVVVFLVVIIALAMFLGAEKIEQISRGTKRILPLNRKFNLTAAAGLTIVALVVMVMGQPSVAERWSQLPPETRQKLTDKSVFVEPIEMLHVMKGRNVKPVLFDIRTEARFNLFHIIDSTWISESEFDNSELIRDLKTATDSVYFIISDDEEKAANIWKTLTAQKVPNVYILDKGVSGWISYFSHHSPESVGLESEKTTEFYHHLFQKAVGANHELSNPDFHHYKDVSFSPKVKLSRTKAAAGGCG
ncbi:YeeE/YedE family protein [bacterium]|nr:YeeE/YedE family protein [bacterium]